MTRVERLLSFVLKHPNGCWLYAGARDRHGYGVMRSTDSTISAHRLSYEQHVGLIPEGLELDHICCTPWCVNPDHLEPVTHAENMRRIAERNLVRKPTCPKGHPYDAENLFFDKSGKRRLCRECSRARGRQQYAKRRALQPVPFPRKRRTKLVYEAEKNLYCAHGHPATEIKRYPSGSLLCAACRRESTRRWKERRLAEHQSLQNAVLKLAEEER